MCKCVDVDLEVAHGFRRDGCFAKLDVFGNCQGFVLETLISVFGLNCINDCGSPCGEDVIVKSIWEEKSIQDAILDWD
jgi:hypothetical protein